MANLEAGLGPQDDPSSQDRPRLNNDIFDGIFQKYEVRVLGLMGAMVGYLSIFVTTALQTSAQFVLIGFLSLLTFLFLAIDKDFQWKSGVQWVRAFLIIVVCNIITAPQLYYASTLAFDQTQKKLNQQNLESAYLAAKPAISIENK